MTAGETKQFSVRLNQIIPFPIPSEILRQAFDNDSGIQQSKSKLRMNDYINVSQYQKSLECWKL